MLTSDSQTAQPPRRRRFVEFTETLVQNVMAAANIESPSRQAAKQAAVTSCAHMQLDCELLGRHAGSMCAHALQHYLYMRGLLPAPFETMRASAAEAEVRINQES